MTRDQENKLNELHAAIVGNEALGNKGVIKRLEDLEVYKEKDQKFKHKAAGGLAILTPIFAGLWSWLIKHL
jgi:hypothetical protein